MVSRVCKKWKANDSDVANAKLSQWKASECNTDINSL